MARYILGWIECKTLYRSDDEPEWQAAINLDHLLHSLKDFAGFNCLFDDDDDDLDFPALAPSRGLPPNVSERVKADYDDLDAVSDEYRKSCDGTEWLPSG